MTSIHAVMQRAHSLATPEKPTSPQANWIAADEGGVQKLPVNDHSDCHGTDPPPVTDEDAACTMDLSTQWLGVGGGAGKTGILHTSACMAVETRSPVPDPIAFVALAPHSGPTNRHVRGGRRPCRRHPCQPFRLCQCSTSVLAQRGGGFGVAAAARVWSPPVSSKRAAQKVRNIGTIARPSLKLVIRIVLCLRK
jgi:hypothetical protein